MKSHLSYIFGILLLISSDCHPNPGPRTPKYPCGICSKAVRLSKTVRSVACTECEVWYHIDCLGMATAVYEPLETTDVSWYCCNCGIPNFNTSLFTEFVSLSTSTASDVSTPKSDHSFNSDLSFSHPVSTSSPARTHVHDNNNIHKRVRILNINFQSIKSKREEFWSILDQCDPDIVLATETWLNTSIMEAEVLPPGYKFAARRDRPTSSHGGVAIITRDNIDASEIPLTTQAEMVAASIPSKSTKPIIVSSIYRPTDNNKEYTAHLCDTIQQLHSSYRDHIFWIGGDSNLPDINWKTDNIEGHQYPISISQDFIDLFRDIGCQQVIDFPTRQSNTLDIFATNRPSLVSKCLGLPGLSDHDVILIDTTITAQKRRPVRRLIHILSKADIDAITADLEQYSQTLRERETSLPINTLWNEFKSVCTSTIHKNIPSKYTST